MGRDRRDRSPFKGFDKVQIPNMDGTEREVMDISRFAQNSAGRYRQDVTINISNQYPAEHILGVLVNGEYVAGTLKDESIVRETTIVVLEPFDKPVKLSVGTVKEPKKYVADFDASQARGTIAITKDCNLFVGNTAEDEIIVTVEGADKGLAGDVVVILEVSKLGASTLMPSN